jgi:hypothetical protein
VVAVVVVVVVVVVVFVVVVVVAVAFVLALRVWALLKDPDFLPVSRRLAFFSVSLLIRG